MLFISYTWSKDNGNFGFGNFTVKGNGILSKNDLEAVEKQIKNDIKKDRQVDEDIIVVILNWRKYDSPE